MAASALTAALTGVSQLLPAQPVACQRLNIAACSAAAASTSGWGSPPMAMERCVVEAASSVLTGSLSCSPPRAGTAHNLRRALAPSHCLAPGKTRRRRRRRAGGDESGGGDGDDGGSFGGGGGDWFDGWDGSESPDDALSEGFWIWQVLCVISLFQTFQFLLENGQAPVRPQGAPAAGFATLSRSFYSRRMQPKGLLPA